MATQSIPMWQTVVGLLGLGSLIATGLSHWLSTRAEREKWINDNKKLEWRELIDELDGSLEQMSYTFHQANVVAAGDDRNSPMAGVIRGNRAIHGRIFIAGALKEHGLVERWRDLTEYANLGTFPPLARPVANPTLFGFNSKAVDFRDDLLRIAQEDLGIK
jgi:hypothetical protein